MRTWIELHGERPEPLLAWALEHAPGRRVFSGGWESDKGVRRAIEAAGFRLVRHSYRMAIALDGADTAGGPLADLELRSLLPGEERAVYEAHMETFEDSWEHLHEPYERWSHWMLGSPRFDPSLWLLALDGDRIAGIALCRVDEEEAADGWIQVLGVRRPWRRQGLGRALLHASFAELAARGCRRALLGVDAESLTAAHRLYERAGMHVAARFDIYEKSQ